MPEFKVPSIPDSDNVGWIVAPALRCAGFVAEQAKVGGTVQRALIALAGQKRLILASRQLAVDRGVQPPAALDELLRQQETLGPWAQELVAGDYRPIHASTLIAIWSAIEIAVEDTATLILLKDPDAVQRIVAAGLDVRKQLTSTPNEDTARRAVGALERRLRQTLAAGPALAEMLRLLGISIAPLSEVLDTLTEVNAVRNCLLHRGGVADSALAVQAPALSLVVGDMVKLTSQMMDTYYKAVSDFAVALTYAVVERFKETRPPSEHA